MEKATIDLLFGDSDIEDCIDKMMPILSEMGVDKPALLARFLITLEHEHPWRNRPINKQALIGAAIDMYREKGVSALPVMQSIWIEECCIRDFK